MKQDFLTIDRSFLSDRIGMLSPRRLNQLIEGLRLVLGL